MSLNIPNQAAAAFARQAAWHSVDIDAIVAAFAGDGVLSGLACTAQGSPDMTVAVAAGQARVGGYFPYVSGQNATISAADSTLARIDIISVNYNGTITVTAGTAAASPVAPALPANNALLAQVYVPAADTAIGSNQITDKRVAVTDTFDIADEFMSGALVTTGNFGSNAWGMTGSTPGTAVYQTGKSLHPGILRLVTGTTSGNNQRIHFGSSATTAQIFPANVSRIRALVAVPTITTIAIKLGIGVDVSDSAAGSLGTAGAFIEFVPATSAKWRYTTRQASTSTTNADTGADVVAGNWYQFDIVRLQNGDWQFAKNGVLAFTHSANQPTTVSTIGFLAHTLTTAARNLDIDFFGMNFAPLGNRFT